MSGSFTPRFFASQTEGRQRGALAAKSSWPRDVRIRVLERPSPRTVSVAWGHPCSGYAGGQTWRRVMARKNGVCALSGERVLRGDPIYKLARSSERHNRADEVLLARHVDAILQAQESTFPTTRHATVRTFGNVFSKEDN
ncbi:hypothetical protein BURK_008936 [Burkholderia sp. SJ98]|nr:hypothetical protein BURK_008936 [Burkholderia sp. SJ98]